jgi:hypothetical protein
LISVTKVLRLTSSILPDPRQLQRQAETIAGLIEQRNYLIQQAEEQKSRWEAEKDGWARMAEALIARRNKGGSSAGKDEVGCLLRLCIIVVWNARDILDAEPPFTMTFDAFY